MLLRNLVALSVAVLTSIVSNAQPSGEPCKSLGPITGEANPCIGGIYDYYVPRALGGRITHWGISGAVSGTDYEILLTTTTSLKIQFKTTRPLKIAANADGCSIEFKTNLPISVGNTTVAKPSSIFAAAPACINGAMVQYSVEPRAGGTFIWELMKDNQLTTENFITVNANNAGIEWATGGTYVLLAKFNNGVCSSSPSVTEIDAGAPTSPAVVAPGFLCLGATNFTHSATSGLKFPTYSWSTIDPLGAQTDHGTGAEKSITYPNKPGVYQLKVVASNACGTASTIKPIEIRAVPAKPEFTASEYLSCVQNLSATLTLTNHVAGTKYTTPESANYSFYDYADQYGYLQVSTNNEGIYPVVITPNNGCAGPEAQSTIRAISPSSPLDIQYAPTACLNSTVSYSVRDPYTTYTWTVPPGVCELNGSATTHEVIGNSVSVKWLRAGSFDVRVRTNSRDCGKVYREKIFTIKVQSVYNASELSAILGLENICMSQVTLPNGAIDYQSVSSAFSVELNNNSTSHDDANINVSWSVTPASASITNTLQHGAIFLFEKPGSYSLTASINNSCSSSVITKTKIITVKGVPIANLINGGAITESGKMCLGTTRDFSVANPASGAFTWLSSGKITSSTNGSASAMLYHNQTPYFVLYGTDNAAYQCYSPSLRITKQEKQSQTITFNNLDVTPEYQRQVTVTAFASSELPVTISCSDPSAVVINGLTVKFIKVGTFDLIASQEGSDCYYPAKSIIKTVTVRKASQSLVFNFFSQDCGRTVTLNATSDSGLTITSYETSTPDVVEITGDKARFKKTGTATITARQAGNEFYFPASISKSAQVGKGPQTITFHPVGVVCVGTEVRLEASASSGLPLIFGTSNSLVVNFNDEHNIRGLSPGTATITAMQSGDECFNAAPNQAQSVTVYRLPVGDVKSQVICSGETTNIALTSSISGSTFSWTVSSNPANVTGATSGSGATLAQTLTDNLGAGATVKYSVIPQANGCNGNAFEVTVEIKPTAMVNAAPKEICSGQQGSIPLSSSVTGTTFSWVVKNSTNVTGATSGTGTSISLNLTNSSIALGTVTYAITPTAPTGGCPGPAKDVVVTVKPKPSVTNPTMDKNKTVCSDDPFTTVLQSNVPGSAFSWSASVIAGAISNLTTSGTGDLSAALRNSGTVKATAKYVVRASKDGCQGAPSEFLVNVLSRTATSIQGPTTVCTPNGSITLTAYPDNSTYRWSTGATTRTISVNAGSTYNVTVSSANYCLTSTTSSHNVFGVATPAPTINVTSNSLCVSGTAYIGTQSYDSYKWSTGATSQYITINSTGTYSVTVSRSGCTATTSRTIGCSTSTASHEDAEVVDLDFDSRPIRVYPNPAMQEIHLRFSSTPSEGAVAQIFNEYGMVLKAEKLSSSHEQVMDVSSLTAGLHVLRIFDGNRSFIEKIIIIR
jgi:hypothetical protein